MADDVDTLRGRLSTSDRIAVVGLSDKVHRMGKDQRKHCCTHSNPSERLP